MSTTLGNAVAVEASFTSHCSQELITGWSALTYSEAIMLDPELKNIFITPFPSLFICQPILSTRNRCYIHSSSFILRPPCLPRRHHPQRAKKRRKRKKRYMQKATYKNKIKKALQNLQRHGREQGDRKTTKRQGIQLYFSKCGFERAIPTLRRMGGNKQNLKLSKRGWKDKNAL